MHGFTTSMSARLKGVKTPIIRHRLGPQSKVMNEFVGQLTRKVAPPNRQWTWLSKSSNLLLDTMLPIPKAHAKVWLREDVLGVAQHLASTAAGSTARSCGR